MAGPADASPRRAGSLLSDQLHEAARGQVAARVDPRGQDLEQLPLGVATADEVLTKGRQVPGDDELPAGQHVAHDRGDVAVQRPGDRAGRQLGAIGTTTVTSEGNQAAHGRGQLGPAQILEVARSVFQANTTSRAWPAPRDTRSRPARPQPERPRPASAGSRSPRAYPHGAAGLPSQLYVDPAPAGGGHGAGQQPVDLDPVVADTATAPMPASAARSR